MSTKLQNAKRLHMSIQRLKDITDEFSKERIIGQGGYGTVYRGVQANGTTIAVKVLHKSTTGADNRQFKHEFENLIRLEHPNIVRLVGYCDDKVGEPMMHNGETIFADEIYKALCFEYMASGTLTKHISDECDGLGWHTRYKIIKGTWEGLNYLQEEFKEPVYHLDLKPDNILLDENMTPKLADFGSSKLFVNEQSVVINKKFAATIGYIPWEYIFHQVVSKKYDIFSMGVVMIKIIAGPQGNSRSAEMPYQEFIDQVHDNWRNRLQETSITSQPLEAYCHQVNICTAIALRCMDNDRHKRPSIVEIIRKLNETENMIKEVDPDQRWISEHSTVGNKSKEEDTTSKKKSETIGPVTNLTMRTLQEITNDFSDKRSIGEGAYGKVYRGVYDNGEEVAVKLLHNNLQGIDDEQFQNEFNNLMMLNHPNIVRLVGYCYETQRQHMDFQGKLIFGERTYRALCFEFMQMGSLQRHLSDEFSGLDWQTRYKVIKGACEGLKYLHEGGKEPIYHLDLKPNNILLDENMTPKLTDFGLSRMFGEEHSPAGTIGYMPPEYLFRQIISAKLDVFSLGVLITQIIAGPKGHIRSDEMPEQEFIDQVHENWRNRLEATCTSSEILLAYCEQVRICTEIGLSSMGFDRHSRPRIVDIIDRLDETETMIEKVREKNTLEATCASSRTLEAYCEQVSICTDIGLSSMETDRHKRPSVVDITNRFDATGSMIEKEVHWSESMPSWLRADMVKLEAITKGEAIPSPETCNEFPVLLRITGARWYGGEEMPRAGVDVVVVVEVDWCMVLQWRLNIIKQALMIVIDKLGPNDRLSILSFQGNVPCVMKLTFMSDQGRDVAKRMINKLAVNNGYNIIAALREGAEILRGRQVEDGDSRMGCMMFLSDNNDIQIKDMYDKEISSEFPAYVFGLGELHHPEVMKYIADRTRGTYSFVHYDVNEMKNAFKLFITGLTKITATSVKITLTANEGVSISSIYSGGYDSRVTSDKRSGEIDVDNLYAGERKNFIAYLKVPEGNMNKLVTVGGRYQSCIASRQLANTDVSILRPQSAGNPAIHREVAAELVRIRLRKGVVSRSRDPGALEQLWVRIKCSEEGGGAPEETLSELGNDVAEIKRVITHNRSPPYMLSWLTCHNWQRATTKGARCVSGAFTVPGHEDAEDDDYDLSM